MGSEACCRSWQFSNAIAQRRIPALGNIAIPCRMASCHDDPLSHASSYTLVKISPCRVFARPSASASLLLATISL